jgi:hypothetical protein
MKKKLVISMSAIICVSLFFACTKGETTSSTVNSVTPKLEYATYTTLIDVLKNQGYTQKDSLNTTEKAVLQRPVLTTQQLTTNGATRLFFVKGTTDIIQLVRKTTVTWNLPDSIYSSAAMKPIGIYTNGSVQTRVTIEDNTLIGTANVFGYGNKQVWADWCKCWRPLEPPMTLYAN